MPTLKRRRRPDDSKRNSICRTFFISVVACAGGTSAVGDDGKGPEERESATFGGGCFWCMEPPFEKLKGVYAVVSGYSGGKEVNPTYNEVAGGRTGHTEVVQVTYDPDQITYDALLEVFWRSMDPTDSGGQFADRGSQYRPAIFTHGPEQAATARGPHVTLSRHARCLASQSL